MAKYRYQIQRDRVERLPIINEESALSDAPRSLRAILNEPWGGPTVMRPIKRIPALMQKLDPESIMRNPSLGHVRKEVRFEDEWGPTHVDDLINSYLHYARYSNELPVHDDGDYRNRLCPCCKDRNIENMMLGRKGPFRHVRVDKVQIKLSNMLGKNASNERLDPETNDSLHDAEAKFSPRSSWMHYQPLPYATHFLSPEFNRPSVVIDYMNYANNETPTSKEDATYRKIKDATLKYKGAMDKVQGTVSAIEGSGSRDYQNERDYTDDGQYNSQSYRRDYFM